MFVYSMKASTLRFGAVVVVALVTLGMLVAFVPSYSAEEAAAGGSVTVNYSKIKDDGDRKEFLAQFGWTVKDEGALEVEVTIPSEFDKVFAAYNELQKSQGFDLSRYRKKKVMRYTYEVTNYPSYDGVVYVNLLIYRNRVIGADLSSKELDGFVAGLDGAR